MNNNEASTRLNSLVINPPYKFDSLTTSPKIAKFLSFPFGIRIDIYTLFKLTLKGFLATSVLMLITSIGIAGVCLPIKSQNYRLYKEAKSQTNKKLNLLVNFQEATNYKKIFATASSLPLSNNSTTLSINTKRQNNNLNKMLQAKKKYSYIQFAGF